MQAKISTTKSKSNCAIQSPNTSKVMFQQLLLKIQQTNWKDFLTQTVKKYSLETYKLNLLEPKDLSNLYQKLQSKYAGKIFSNQVAKSQRMTWYQNQLRIFIWLFTTSEGIFQTSPSNYKQQHFKELTRPFFKINQHLCHYQCKLILNCTSHRSWQSQQDLILSQIIKELEMKGSWSNISKSLFLLSNKEFFRTPQACRERFQNHLDNTKVRGQWTIQQDLQVIKYVLSIGKKWSIIARYIGNTRTQHMVKNRFQSIIRQQIKSKKKAPRSSHQIQLCKTIFKKLTQKLKKHDEINYQAFYYQKQIKPIQNQKGLNSSNQQFVNTFQKQDIACEINELKQQNPSNSKFSFQTDSSLNVIFQKKEQPVLLFEQNKSQQQYWGRNDQMYKFTPATELQLPLFIDQIFFGNERCLFDE